MYSLILGAIHVHSDRWHLNIDSWNLYPFYMALRFGDRKLQFRVQGLHGRWMDFREVQADVCEEQFGGHYEACNRNNKIIGKFLLERKNPQTILEIREIRGHFCRIQFQIWFFLDIFKFFFWKRLKIYIEEHSSRFCLPCCTFCSNLNSDTF